MDHDAQIALLRALGMRVGEEQVDDEQADDERPNFDGGVRESANESVDPEADHSAFITDLLQLERWRQRGA